MRRPGIWTARTHSLTISAWQVGEGQMATVIESGDGMSVGRVFARGFGVIADNPLTVLGIAFLFGAIPSVVISWFQQRLLATAMDSYQIIGSVGVALVSVLVSLVIQALVQGALVRATLAYARGERATFAQCVNAGFSVLLRLIGLAILMGLGIWLGMIFLLVPGIILFVMWSVASPALVAERTGVFAAFGRSRFLTKGARWKVFGIELIILIAYYLFLGAFGGLMIATVGFNGRSITVTGGLPIGWILATVITSVVVSTVWSTVQSSLYVELRNWKEGLPEQALEEIFA
jgi:hypothetical protein